MEVIFRNPFYLWALLVIPVVIIAHYLSLRYARGRAIKFANFVALARASQTVRINSNLPVLLLRIVVFIAIVFAISGTAVRYTGSQIDADYVIAIDSSASMLAEDLLPTRFDAARQSALSFIDIIPPYSSVGVVGFSGTSFVHQPLTSDKGMLRVAIEGLEVISAGGTSVGDAIVTGTNVLLNSLKPRVIILLTDGRSNLGIDVLYAVDYANANNVIINTVGVGTKEEYFVALNTTGSNLGLDSEELMSIAAATQGEFYQPKSLEELVSVYEQIAGSEKVKASLDLTFFLLLFILVALVLEWVLINTRYRIIP